MSSHDHPQIEQKFALKEIRNITPQKEKRSTSVKDRLDNTTHKNENLPDIHMTPPTARTNTQSDEKQVKEAILAKIRSQNDLLRKQVKDLNSKLTGTSSTAKKTKTKSELEQNFSENLLRRQLQNAYKQIEQYKKQFQVFTDNPEGLDYFEKVKRMEDLLAEKDDKLEEMLTENRVLEKINREQDKELQSYRNTAGYEKKMNTYMEEVRCLKERINNMQAINRHNEHSFKKQQEHLVRMTRQYRMVCDKIGISPSTVFTRPEELDKMMAKKNIQVSRAQEDVIQDFEEAYMTKDNANASAVKVKQERSSSLVASRDGRSLYKRNSSIQNLKEYEQPRKSSEDSHKKDIEPLNSRMFILQSDKKEAKKNDSGYEKSVLTSRFNSEDNRKSIIRHRSLARINLAKNSESQQRISLTYSNIQHDESSFAPSKTELETDVEQNKYIPTKPSENNSVKETTSQEQETPKKSLVVVRKSTGGRIESGLSEFNDKEYLPTPLSSKVTKLMVWSDENFVYGIQAFYQGEDTYYVAGEEHLGIEMKRKAKFVNSIEVEPDDHIEWISGKYEEGITYLKVKTGKGTVKEFGTKTESPNEFKIHVDPHENLTLLHGALYYKKGDENNEDVIILANIGFTLVKETKQ